MINRMRNDQLKKELQMEEERKKKAMLERKNAEALRNAKVQNLEKALKHRPYTYDYDGTIMFVRYTPEEQMPPIITDPRMKERGVQQEKPPGSIHVFKSRKSQCQDDMLKTYFPKIQEDGDESEKQQQVNK